MKMNLKSKVLGVALGAVLTGAVGVLAQTSTQNSTSPATEKQTTTTNNQGNQSCPMMKDGKMDMSKMDMSKMDMPLMDCCKKMGMKTERPKSDDKNSELKPNSNQ